MSQSVEMYNEAYYSAGDKLEAVFHRAGVLRPDQLSCYHYIQKFNPHKPIYSIGCGAGLLEELMADTITMAVLGIDPSEYALESWERKSMEIYDFIPCGLKDFINSFHRYKKEGASVVFCQSLEHIPEDDIKTAMPIFALNHSLIIIANTVNWHPIMPNNDDHITLVDDELFNWIASFGETLFRYKSHLVVQT